MSKITKWKYNDIYESQLRREKLVDLLLSEIIFIKKEIKKYNIKDEKNKVKKALKKLEYLLNLLKDNDNNLSDSDFHKIILFIRGIFKDIVDNIE
ncbi:MAG: hypothetical protein ACFFBH_07710 [Promethearchaeota archaeon]